MSCSIVDLEALDPVVDFLLQVFAGIDELAVQFLHLGVLRLVDAAELGVLAAQLRIVLLQVGNQGIVQNRRQTVDIGLAGLLVQRLRRNALTANFPKLIVQGLQTGGQNVVFVFQIDHAVLTGVIVHCFFRTFHFSLGLLDLLLQIGLGARTGLEALLARQLDVGMGHRIGHFGSKLGVETLETDIEQIGLTHRVDHQIRLQVCDQLFALGSLLITRLRRISPIVGGSTTKHFVETADQGIDNDSDDLLDTDQNAALMNRTVECRLVCQIEFVDHGAGHRPALHDLGLGAPIGLRIVVGLLDILEPHQVLVLRRHFQCRCGSVDGPLYKRRRHHCRQHDGRKKRNRTPVFGDDAPDLAQIQTIVINFLIGVRFIRYYGMLAVDLRQVIAETCRIRQAVAP